MFCFCGLRQSTKLYQSVKLEILQNIMQNFARGKLLQKGKFIAIVKQQGHRLRSSNTIARSEELDTNVKKTLDINQIHQPFQELEKDFNHKCSVDIDSVFTPNDFNGAVNGHQKNNISKVMDGKNMPQYPLRNIGNDEDTFTANFERSQQYLQSLNIPIDELASYPDVQEMSDEEIDLCLDRLKEVGIHHVFSLFLIQRIFAELNLERTAKRGI